MPFLGKQIEGVERAEENKGYGEKVKIKRDPEPGQEEQSGQKRNREIGEAGKLVKVYDKFAGHWHRADRLRLLGRNFYH